MAAGKEIKRLRENNVPKISAAKAASLLGVDAERLRKWEQRDSDPSDLEDAHKIEQYFGVALGNLKNIGNFQFIERGGGKDAFIDIATKMHDAGHLNNPNDYVQSLKAQIVLLEKINDGLEKRLSAMEVNLNEIRSNQLGTFSLLREAAIQAAMYRYGKDKKKLDSELHEINKIVGAVLK